MKRLAIILTLCVGCLMAANAQSSFTQRLQQSKTGEGTVTVTQDKAIEDLVNGPKTTISTKQPQTSPQKLTDNKSTATNQDKKDDKTVQQPHVTAQPQQPDTTTVTTQPDDNRKKVMKGGQKVGGYRVQVYAGGNSRDARIKAERTGKEINALFPGTPVYVHFYSPRWICRMGNYRTYEEAHEVLRAVKKLGYDSAIIVKGKITVQYQSVTPLNSEE